MDSLLSAYHFNRLEFIQEVKAKLMAKDKKNPDLVNKEATIQKI
jgi:hypothetical protein